MKFLKKDIQKKKISDSLVIDEYCSDRNDLPIDGAVAHFANTSFGPKINRNFTELFFVLKGRIAVEIDGKRHILNEHDIFIIPPDKTHTIHGYDAQVFIACSPMFNPKNVEMV